MSEDETYADRFIQAIDLYLANLFEDGNALLQIFDKASMKALEGDDDDVDDSDPIKMMAKAMLNSSRDQMNQVFVSQKRMMEDLKSAVRASYRAIRMTEDYFKASYDKLSKGFD